MKKLIIFVSDRNVDRLLSMMFLDKGKYEFEREKEAIIITFNENVPDSVHSFIQRFSTWFSYEVFFHYGDRYFKKHPHHELWKIWKQDFRFPLAYCDEFYLKWVERELEDFFSYFQEYDIVEIFIEDLVDGVEQIVKIRLELISFHFDTNFHLEYIESRIQNWMLTNHHKDGMKPVTCV